MPIDTILAIPGHITRDKVDVWFQDEVRIGQQSTTTRLWATKGSRSRAVKQQPFDYAYMFGAVCPTTRETEALIAPHVNKDLITRHLEQIWSGLRQHHLANRCFSGYDDIVDAFSMAWNDFVSDVKRVTKMCSRDWLEVNNY
jgi:hypothetical protein